MDKEDNFNDSDVYIKKDEMDEITVSASEIVWNICPDFKDALGRDWDDISSELWREYTFFDGAKIKIENPAYLNVSESGGHRIFDCGD